jgi:hypothetical protein
MNRFSRFSLYVFLPLVLLAASSYSVFKYVNTSEDSEVVNIKVPEGFAAEHLYSSSDNNKGSWVSMCFDDKGRMIASDQYGGIYRLSIPRIGEKLDTNKIEKIKLEKEIPKFSL